MKSAISLFSFIFVLFLANPIFAQGHAEHHPEEEKRTGMMGKNGSCCAMISEKETKHSRHGDMGKMNHNHMMQGMMQHRMMGTHDEIRQSMHTVQHLPFLGEQLDLTESQIEQLKKMRTDFRTHKANLDAAIKKNHIDLERLIDENESVSRVRAGMKAVSDVQVELNISAYETANQMLDVLTNDQKQQYASMSMQEQCPMHSGGMHGMMSIHHQEADEMECMMMASESEHRDHHNH